LKGLLQEHRISFPKTHQLEKLVDLLPLDVVWAGLRPGLIALNQYAVEFRYPGATADKAELKRALVVCRAARSHARLILGLK
jgi:HEPN domain-containing protein